MVLIDESTLDDDNDPKWCGLAGIEKAFQRTVKWSKDNTHPPYARPDMQFTVATIRHLLRYIAKLQKVAEAIRFHSCKLHGDDDRNVKEALADLATMKEWENQ